MNPKASQVLIYPTSNGAGTREGRINTERNVSGLLRYAVSESYVVHSGAVSISGTYQHVEWNKTITPAPDIRFSASLVMSGYQIDISDVVLTPETCPISNNSSNSKLYLIALLRRTNSLVSPNTTDGIATGIEIRLSPNLPSPSELYVVIAEAPYAHGAKSITGEFKVPDSSLTRLSSDKIKTDDGNLKQSLSDLKANHENLVNDLSKGDMDLTSVNLTTGSLSQILNATCNVTNALKETYIDSSGSTVGAPITIPIDPGVGGPTIGWESECKFIGVSTTNVSKNDSTGALSSDPNNTPVRLATSGLVSISKDLVEVVLINKPYSELDNLTSADFVRIPMGYISDYEHRLSGASLGSNANATVSGVPRWYYSRNYIAQLVGIRTYYQNIKEAERITDEDLYFSSSNHHRGMNAVIILGDSSSAELDTKLTANSRDKYLFFPRITMSNGEVVDILEQYRNLNTNAKFEPIGRFISGERLILY